MPKIPDYTALGQPASFKTGRAMVDFPGVKAGPEAFGADVAAGIQKLGQVGVGLADDQRKEDDAIDLSRADAQAQKRLIETRRAFESDPDYKTFGPRFDQQANGILADSASMIRNPSLRDRWVESKGVLEAARTKDQVVRHGDALARQGMLDQTESTLKTRRDAYLLAQSDSERAQILRSADDDIALGVASGYLRPQDARKLRDRHVEGMKVDDGEARLARSWQDPNEALGLIRDLSGNSETAKRPSVGQTSESGLDFIRARESFSPKAYRDGTLPDGRPRYSIGYGTLASGPDDTISRADAEKRLVQETSKVDDWIRKNVKVPITQAQHDALNSFGYNLGTGALDRLKEDINGGNFDVVGQRMRSFNKMRDPDTGELVDNAGLSSRRIDEAEMLMGRSPGARYAGLDFRKRHALLTHARNALSTTLQQDAKDAATLLEQGQDPPKDAHGRTAFDRVRMVLQPNQITKMNILENEARMKGRTVFGDGMDAKPLSDLSETEAMDRIAKLAGDSSNARSTAKVQTQAEKLWGKISDQRKRDPAQAVSGMMVAGPAGPQISIGEDGQLVMREGEDGAYKFAPSREVRNAAKLIQSRIPDAILGQDADGSVSITTPKGPAGSTQHQAWGALFEARRAAQTRLGVQEFDQRLITKREAKELLQIPEDPTKISERQYLSALKSAADRAEMIYGEKYGPKVFQDAVSLHIKGKPYDNKAGEKSDAMLRAAAKLIATGERISDADSRKFSALGDLDLINQSFLQPRMSPLDAERPLIAPQSRPTQDAAQSRRAWSSDQTNTAGQLPNDQQKEWIRSNPDGWQQFDLKFGKGAAARALNGR